MKFFDNLFRKTNDPAPAEQLTLETLLQRSASEAAYRPEFYRRVLSDDLIVITAGGDIAEGSRVLAEETKVNIVSLEHGVIPVFTSKERIFDKGVITEQVQFMQMAGRDLFTITKGAKLVLNPYSDYGKEFLPDEIEEMLDGTLLTNTQQELVYKESTNVLIGSPAKYPNEIVSSLKVLFSGKPRIAAAYVAWIHDASTSVPPHYIFGLKADGVRDEELQNIINEAGFTARQHLSPNEFVDFLVIDNNGGISDHFLKNSEPFYTRP